MNIVLTAREIDKLLAMGFYRDRRIPRRAVLIMPGPSEDGLPFVIDEHGHKTPLTLEQASEL